MARQGNSTAAGHSERLGNLGHVAAPNAGTSTPPGGISVDLRPGGLFETVMVNDAGGRMCTMRVVYVEVRRPDWLVWTEPDAGMTKGRICHDG